ncbi:DUF7500 family protein [Halovivax gelatinilyticus]|uniref:DUF7500 family protein n=1 Tax=Halovivax gelatinilyticus TaxID=2961597 RepID=UPI0020CA6BA3|nr:hypothetical protein [Halovivax gelatinilyticus]
MTPDTDDGVLDPEDLTLDPELVDRIEDNRFVVRPDDSKADRPTSLDRNGPDTAQITDDRPETLVDPPAGALDPDPTSATESQPRVLDPEVKLANEVSPHGVDITLKTDGEVARHRTTSNDIREVFADMMAWYANQLDEDLTPMEALEVLVAATDLE